MAFIVPKKSFYRMDKTFNLCIHSIFYFLKANLFSNYVTIFRIHKKASFSSVNNYRPLTFENSYLSRLGNFRPKHKITIKDQHGFCSDQVNRFCFELFIKAAIDCNYPLDVFCYLSQTFDYVSYLLLIRKLFCYGIERFFLKWVLSFLVNKTRYLAFKWLVNKCELKVRAEFKEV